MFNMNIDWQTVEDSLSTLRPVKGGFTNAKRGIIAVGGTDFFVKIATDELSREWIEREVRVYRFLEELDYAHAAKLASVNADSTGLCLEAFPAEDGWDWTNTYSKDRVTSILQLMDDMRDIGTEAARKSPVFHLPNMSKQSHGWAHILANEELRSSITTWLTRHGHDDVAAAVLDSQYIRDDFDRFEFKHDSLVHQDVRGDNCAWNAELGVSKLVDWNWADLGDHDIDKAAFLTNVEVSGMSVADEFCTHLRPGAFLWLTGYWLEVMVNHRPGKQLELMLLQMQSAVTAYKIYTTIR